MTKTCPTCGKTFEARTVRAKYCSKRCCNRHSHPLVPILDKACVFCGNHFKTKKPNARYCSSACARRMRLGWASLADFEKAQAERQTAYNKRHERDRFGLTLAQIQEVIDAQDGDPSLLWKRSQHWTKAQRKYAKQRYEEKHGLFVQTYYA